MFHAFHGSIVCLLAVTEFWAWWLPKGPIVPALSVIRATFPACLAECHSISNSRRAEILGRASSRLRREGDAPATCSLELDNHLDMNHQHADAFPPEVIQKLKTYVYRLIDPRNGETFYIGKGKGNRVFAHIRGEQGIEGDDLDNGKIKRIRQIRLAGFEVAHVIHRHGMDDGTAFEVESALIDAYPGLTNQVGGVGGNEFGAMHAIEIIREYAAEPAEFRHNAILISVNRSALAESSLYDATRYAWKISPSKARKAEVILATVQGVIKGAFVAEQWLEATASNFPGRQDVPGRYGFVGREAPVQMQKLYVDKRVPDEYRKRGAANPIKYASAAT